jgi:2-phosphosulfolactate phosphatase
MRQVDVCLTPELLHLYPVEGKVVVVVDVLRATSCITTGIAHGVEKIIPVATLEECSDLRKKGYVAAAERDGKKAEGFDIGNSPFSYMDEKLQGKTVAVTTTNGTLAITRCREAAEVIVGSFLNRAAIVNYLLQQSNDVLVVCAGWKGKMNLEDTLFAGAVIEGLKEDFSVDQDAALAALTLFRQAENNLRVFLSDCSHVKRLKGLHIDKDIEFCLQYDIYDAIPVLKDGALVLMQGEMELNV